MSTINPTPTTEQSKPTYPDSPPVEPTKVDGDPTRHNAGSTQRDAESICNQLATNPAIKEIDGTGIHTATLSVGVVLSEGYDKQDLREIADSLKLEPFHAVEITPTALLSRAGPISAQSLDYGLQIHYHPLRLLTISALNTAGITDHTNLDLTWSPNTEKLSPDTSLPNWETVAPITITFDSLVEMEHIRRFEKFIRELYPPLGITEYVTSIDKTDIAKQTDENGNPIAKQLEFSIGYDRIHESEPEKIGTISRKRGDVPSIRDDGVNIIQGNSEELPHKDDTHNSTLAKRIANTGITEKFQLTVTSPVYLNAIDYQEYESTQTKDYTGSDNSGVEGHDNPSSVDAIIDAWEQQQKEIFGAVYNATQPGGYCAVIIGPTKTGDQYVDLPAKMSELMTGELNWNLEDKITWHKTTGGISQFGTTIQNPRPTYFHTNQLTEQILIFRRGERVNRNNGTSIIKQTRLTKEEVANNIWHVPPIPPESVDHPCPFPEELVRRLVELYTYPDETILDPLAGAGTTPRVANKTDRRCLGVEIQPKFVREARRRTFIEEYTRNSQKVVNYEEIPPEESEITEEQEGTLQRDLSRFN